MSKLFAQVGNEFDQEFRTKLASRYESFKPALNLLASKASLSVNILETGCVRLKDDYGAGNSTYVFAYYLQNYAKSGSTLTSVDISEDNLSVCRGIINPHYPPELREWHFNLIKDDSVHYLESVVQGNGKFELIYLDSLDANLEHRDLCTQAQEHQLKEAQLAVKLFSNRLPFKILLLDDANLPFGGKVAKTHEFLLDESWVCVVHYQQSLWIKVNE